MFPDSIKGCAKCGCRLPGELWHGPACRCEPVTNDHGLVRLGAEKAMEDADPSSGIQLIKEGYDLLVASGDHEGARHALIVAESILEVRK